MENQNLIEYPEQSEGDQDTQDCTDKDIQNRMGVSKKPAEDNEKGHDEAYNQYKYIAADVGD